MSVASAFTGVVLIWSTTPLAIKWSGEGIGFLFALTSRLSVGLLCLLLLCLVMRSRIRWRDQAWKIHVAAGLGVYFNMMFVYWAAQKIPSGWISVLYGLTPITTSLFARLWLREHPMYISEIVGALLGFAGLVVMFANSFQHSDAAILGVVGTLLAVMTQAAAAVWVKRLQRGQTPQSGIALTTAGMLVTVPMLLLTWLGAGAEWPDQISQRALGSTLYLGAIGTGVGFTLYFYLLQKTSVRAVALVTLLTPVVALWLGHAFNAEVISGSTVMGTIVILIGLSVSQFGQMVSTRRQQHSASDR